ncbi:MAG: hypothetical protein ACI8W9_002105 [Psychromonas sp.]|jgi:hypothetical protein
MGPIVPLKFDYPNIINTERLLAIGYQLSAIGYQLLAIGYRLTAIG